MSIFYSNTGSFDNLETTSSLIASGTVIFTSIVTSSTAITNVLMISSSGQVYYTGSDALGGSGTVGPGEKNYLAFFSGSTTTISNSIVYQSGSTINIGDTSGLYKLTISGSGVSGSLNVNNELYVSGSKVTISDYLKIGTDPYPSYSNLTSSRFDAVDLKQNPTSYPGTVYRIYSNHFGNSSFTSIPARFVGLQSFMAFEPTSSLTYDVTPTSWDSIHSGIQATFGIGASGSAGPLTTFNSGKTLKETNYTMFAGFDAWPEFDEGTTQKTYTGWYANYGGTADLVGAAGSTMERFMFYTAGEYKRITDFTLDTSINYYSAPVSRSGITNPYGFYQSGSSDTNYFEGRVAIGSGSNNTTSGSLYVSGTVYFPTLTMPSTNVTDVLILSSSGQVFYTASSALGGGSSVLTAILLANQTVGGVNSGTSYPIGTSLETIIRNILIKYIPPTIGTLSLKNGGTTVLASSTFREVSSSLTYNTASFTSVADNPNGRYPYSASFTASGGDIGNLNYYFGNNVLGSTNNLWIGSTSTTNRTTPGTVTFTVNSMNPETLVPNSITTTTNLYYVYPIFYGMSTTDYSTTGDLYSDAGITTSLGFSSGTKIVPYNGTLQYVYFAYPATANDLSSIKDGTGNELLPTGGTPTFLKYTRTQNGSGGLWSGVSYKIYMGSWSGTTMFQTTILSQNYTFTFA